MVEILQFSSMTMADPICLLRNPMVEPFLLTDSTRSVRPRRVQVGLQIAQLGIKFRERSFEVIMIFGHIIRMLRVESDKRNATTMVYENHYHRS